MTRGGSALDSLVAAGVRCPAVPNAPAAPLATASLRRIVLAGVVLVAVVASAPRGPAQAEEGGASQSSRERLLAGDSGARPEVVRHRIFFPPNPPPFGVQVQVNRGGQAGGRAPERLAAYVTEPFYAPLSTRLTTHRMTPEVEGMLADFTKVRASLRQELLDHLEGVKDGDAATRLRLNLEFARVQTPRLAALEEAAERLRRELYRTGRFGAALLDWSAAREWKLGRSALKRPREENLLLEYQVARAAVFYQEGLLPEQRRLLREVVMDLEDEVFRRGSGTMAGFGFVFFSPDTVRIRFPAGLPREAAALLEAYDGLKSSLKLELRDRLYELDAAVFQSSRTRELEAMGPGHRSRVATLEEMAEDVRRELVDTALFPRPEAPVFVSEALEAMIAGYETALRRVQDGLVRRIVEVRRSLGPPPRGDPAAELEWRERLAERTEAAAEAHSADQAGAMAAVREQAAEIAAILEKLDGGGEHLLAGTPEQALANFLRVNSRARGEFVLHHAVLEPGFSPEQRRLLLGLAVEAMELPLPGGELQPTSLPGTLLPLDEIGK